MFPVGVGQKGLCEVVALVVQRNWNVTFVVAISAADDNGWFYTLDMTDKMST